MAAGHDLLAQARAVLSPLERTAIVVLAAHGGDVDKAYEEFEAMGFGVVFNDKFDGATRVRQGMKGDGARRRRCDNTDKATPMIERTSFVVSRDEFVGAVAAAKRRLRALAEAQGRRSEEPPPRHTVGKRVTLPRAVHVTHPSKEDVPMEASRTPLTPGPTQSEGFADRVQREANEEAVAVLADLSKVRFRADQVVRVLRALGLVVPPELAELVGGTVKEPPQPPPPPAEAKVPERQEATDGGQVTEPPPAPAKEQAPPPAPARGKVGGVVQHGGVEVMSEHLRGMPSAKKNMPVGDRTRICEEELAIVKAVEEQPATSGELGAKLGLAPHAIGDRIRTLGAAGLLRLTGDQRNGSGEYAPGTGEPIGFTGALAAMPAAASSESLGHTAVLQAMQQLRVLNAARSRGKATFVPSELDELVAMPRARAIDAINALAEQGVHLKRSGKMRRGEKQTAGRTSVEYVLTKVGDDGQISTPEEVAQAAADQAVREAATAPPGAPQAEQVEAAHLARVRDFVVKQREPFSPAQVADAVGLPERIVRPCLAALIERNSVEYVGMDDLELYEYSKPTGPGAAAKLDVERRKASSQNGAGASGPVPGTGRRLHSSHKETDAFCAKAERAGGQVEKAGSGHIAIVNPANGKRFIISATPSSTSMQKNEKKLREIGLAS